MKHVVSIAALGSGRTTVVIVKVENFTSASIPETTAFDKPPPLASISNVSGHIPLTFGGTPCPFKPVQHSPGAQLAGRPIPNSLHAHAGITAFVSSENSAG